MKGVLRLVVILGGLAAGCMRIPPPGPGPRTVAVQEGYVWVGELAPLHPLWPCLREMEQRAGAVERPEGLPSLGEFPSLARPQLELPSAVRLAPLPVPELRPPMVHPTPSGEGLPGDLAAAVEARRREAVRRYQQRLAEAEAQESVRRAELEIGLWREYQLALNNLAIRSSLGGPDAADARAAREKILAALEARLAEAAEQSRQRLEKRKQELYQQMMEEIARAEREAAAEAQRRHVPALELGEAERRLLRNRLGIDLWQPELKDGIELQSRLKELGERYEAAVERQQKGLAARREQQARRLRASAAVLRRLIRGDLETAVRALALANGMVVHIPPLEPARGSNMTALFANMLRQQWATAR